ncbi:MAG: hypothetical protein KDD35_12960, partial [Bdellovibrionales bacterium]|nr:hypothetical protein [Bdellovibrionales bacterium]
FMHDSRYRAKVPGSIELLKRRAGTAFGCIVSERPYFMYYLLQGVLSLNKGDNFGVTRHACRGSIPEELLEILEQAHDYGMSFLPTWEPLGIRAINRLYALRFYPVGLMDHDVKADGARMNRMKFLEHDLKHAIIYERIIRPSPQEEGRPPPNIFTQQFYRQFNYHANISRMSPNDQLLYDLGHFLYFHEGLGLSVFGHDLSWSIPKNNLQEFYRSTYFHGLSSEFRFEFSPSDEIRVLRRQDPKVLIRNLVYRLLDENDMRHQLPLEIETLIKNSPDKADEIVGNFAEKFLTLFFRIHYKVAKQTLELFESQNSP